jgi:hypothetical protein
MSDDYAFFEYQAKLTNTGHAENEGKLVHCMISNRCLVAKRIEKGTNCSARTKS